jgi:branched-chain amino acid transport system permease protein
VRTSLALGGLGIAFLLVWMALENPLQFVQFFLNSAAVMPIYALLAFGFTLVYRTVWFFDLTYGTMAAIAGFATYSLAGPHRVDPYLSAGVGVFIAGGMSAAVYAVIYRAMRQRARSRTTMFVTSLAMLLILQVWLAIVFGSQSRTLPGMVGTTPVRVLGGTITPFHLATVAIAVAVIGGLVVVLKITRFGKIVRAISDDEETMRVLGVNTGVVMGAVFFIGGGVAGLVGVLVGLDVAIRPEMGFPLMLKGFIAAVVGGTGSLYGSVVGAVTLAFVENYGVWYLAPEWKDAIALVFLGLVLCVRPTGLLRGR